MLALSVADRTDQEALVGLGTRSREPAWRGAHRRTGDPTPRGEARRTGRAGSWPWADPRVGTAVGQAATGAGGTRSAPGARPGLQDTTVDRARRPPTGAPRTSGRPDGAPTAPRTPWSVHREQYEKGIRCQKQRPGSRSEVPAESPGPSTAPSRTDAVQSAGSEREHPLAPRSAPRVALPRSARPRGTTARAAGAPGAGPNRQTDAGLGAAEAVVSGRGRRRGGGPDGAVSRRSPTATAGASALATAASGRLRSPPAATEGSRPVALLHPSDRPATAGADCSGTAGARRGPRSATPGRHTGGDPAARNAGGAADRRRRRQEPGRGRPTPGPTAAGASGRDSGGRAPARPRRNGRRREGPAGPPAAGDRPGGPPTATGASRAAGEGASAGARRSAGT